MEVITKYVTEDGKEFEDEKDAQRHEARIRLDKELSAGGYHLPSLLNTLEQGENLAILMHDWLYHCITEKSRQEARIKAVYTREDVEQLLKDFVVDPE